MSTWSSHGYTYVPSLPPFFPIPPLLGCHRALTLGSLHHTANSHQLSIFTYGNACVSVLLSQIIPPSPSPTVSKSLSFMSASPFLLCSRIISTIFLSSVQCSRSVVSDSLWPHESQHARPPCPSPTPREYSNPCPSSRWCHSRFRIYVLVYHICLSLSLHSV